MPILESFLEIDTKLFFKGVYRGESSRGYQHWSRLFI